MQRLLYVAALLAVLGACKGASGKSGAELAESADTVSADAPEEEYYYDDEGNKKKMYAGGHVSVSEDGRMTVESGVRPGGGTSPEYWAKYKFLNRRGDTCTVLQKYSPYISAVHSVRKNDGGTYYVVNCMAKASSAEAEEWVEACRVSGDTLRQVSVADGESDAEQDDFRVSYSIPDWYFATNGEGYDWLFEYDPATRRLFVPLQDKHDPYRLTDRYRVWQFDGGRFVDKGEQPHKDLHPSVRAYCCVISYFTTKDYIVRVDSLDDRQLRYASWRKPKTMADAPDVVITGGVRRTFPTASGQNSRDDEFSFRKGGVEYVAGHEEVKPRADGSGAESRKYLLVKKRGRVVLKQEMS